jgi:hypothetical protein
VALASVGVVYLYRFAEGEVPARAFLESYCAHPAGTEHDLHVILKGFPDKKSYDSARALFDPVRVNLIELDDTGYDIGSYIAAAKRISNDQLLFFNTFSEVLADRWLSHLCNALNRPGVGLVGATGSWQSQNSGYTAVLLRFAHWVRHPVAYARSYFELDAGSGVDAAAHRRSLGDIFLKIRGLADVYEFRGYPNPHLRTNAFMIERDRFLSLRHVPFRRKADVYKFESGRHSLTKQVLAMNLKVLVVDRRGTVYDMKDWRSSSTFWSENQENLMISDNTTRKYSFGSPQLRHLLQNYAWYPPRCWPIWPRASVRV